MPVGLQIVWLMISLYVYPSITIEAFEKMHWTAGLVIGSVFFTFFLERFSEMLKSLEQVYGKKK